MSGGTTFVEEQRWHDSDLTHVSSVIFCHVNPIINSRNMSVTVIPVHFQVPFNVKSVTSRQTPSIENRTKKYKRTKTD